MSFQVAEPTLSPAVSSLLEKFLGCKIASEGVLAGKKQFDFFLILDGVKVIVELKIGGLEKLAAAIAQAEEYKENVGADGVIVIVYPIEARQTVSKPDEVEFLATELRPIVTVLCPFLKHYYPKISLAELSQKLKEAIAKPIKAPSVDLVVQALRQSVQGISLEIRHSSGMDSPIITLTVGSLALFEILSQDHQELSKENEEAVKGVVADLAAYILVNQILLYHILNKALNLKKRIETVTAPMQLVSYFDVINAIDYKAVYCTDIASYISPEAVNEINTVILAIRALEPENLQHDLLGRIFHEFLPFETRKRLGTFYTRPQAADILAGLAIDSPYEKVLDPACGSGTLLVSAYHRKMLAGKPRPHKKIVEEEITGVDIMPFAAHLAALNLTMQAPLEPTDKTRIGTGNSLNLTSGDEVGNVAGWLREFGGDVVGVEIDKPVKKGEIFKLQPVDVVIMNPPFTRKENLTPGMKSIKWASFGEQNYWAYFIPLSDSVLKKNGKIAAVLPRDFFRGQNSRGVREFLFKDNAYTLDYVVKTTKDSAFSESARFRDYLIVMKKDGGNTPCAFVYLKKKLGAFTPQEITDISLTVKQLEKGTKFEDDSIMVTWKDQSEISANYRDLGQFVTFNTQAGEYLLNVYNKALKKAGIKVTTLCKSKPPISVLRGFEPTVENLLNLIFVVRPISKERAGRSELVLVKQEQDGNITVSLKDSPKLVELSNKVVKKGLKTASYVPQIDIDNISDFAILKPFDGLTEIQNKLGIPDVNFKDISNRANDRFSHLLLSRRFNYAAPGTKALAFFSSEKALGSKAFWTFSSNLEQSKALCLWLNSTFSFINSLLMQSETEGSFVELTKEKVLDLHIPNLSAELDALLTSFDKVKYVNFQSLIDQYENPPEERKTIDRAVFSYIGYSEPEIDNILPELYSAMATELRSWKELMHQSSSKTDEPSPQLHLFAKE